MTTLTPDTIAGALFQVKFDGLDLKQRISELYSTAGMLAVQHIGQIAQANVQQLEGKAFPVEAAPKHLASDLDGAYSLWTSLMTRMKEEREIDIADPLFLPKFATLYCQLIENKKQPTMLKAWYEHTGHREVREYLERALNSYEEDV